MWDIVVCTILRLLISKEWALVVLYDDNLCNKLISIDPSVRNRDLSVLFVFVSAMFWMNFWINELIYAYDWNTETPHVSNLFDVGFQSKEESSQVAILRKIDATMRNSICRQVVIEYVRHRCFHDFTVTYFERMCIDCLVCWFQSIDRNRDLSLLFLSSYQLCFEWIFE